MKRILTVLLMLLPVLLPADNVKPEKAREIAEKVLMSSGRTKSSSLHLQMVWDGQEPSPVKSPASDGESPAFYVFNNVSGKGFVVVSGEDRTVPVLACSFDSNIRAEDMPVNFRNWMGFIRQEVNHARKLGIPASDRVRALWKQAHLNGQEIGNVLSFHQTASWDQAAPYWDECPKYRGQRTYTGCVITAVSTVMKFHRWPDCGTGRTDPYTSDTKKIKVPGRTLGQPYHWDNMPLKYFNEAGKPVYSREQGAEVARLMADVGAILQADYGTDDVGGTGAFSVDIPGALVQYMKYDRSIFCASRDHYPFSRWLEMLKAELESSPIVYGGVSKDGGHSFVIDGYTDKDYFHVNWGWGGMSDGYFLLSALDPEQQGAGGSDSGFDTMQDAILNMRPDHGGQAFDQMIILPVEDEEYDIHYSGIVASLPEIRRNVEFKVTAGALINGGFEDFECEVVIAHVDRDGKMKEILYTDRFAGTDKLEVGYVYGIDDVKVTIHGEIRPGDRIKLFYKSTAMKDYIPVLGAPEDGFTYELLLSEVKEPDIREPEFAKEISLLFDKDGGKLMAGCPEGVTASLTAPDGKDITSRLETGKYLLTLDVKGLASGTYTFVFQKGKSVKKLMFKL